MYKGVIAMGCEKAIIEKMMDSGIVRSVEETAVGCFIDTDFTLSDGDVLVIYLDQKDGSWILTDHGHTIGWLYDHLVELTDARRSIIERTMVQCGTRYDRERIVRDISDDPVLDLRLMITALIRVADLCYLDRRTVRSTFLDDMKAMFEERFPSCETGKVVTSARGERFRIDVYVDRERPLLVFGVRTKDRCKDASIAIMALSEGTEFDSVAIVDEDADIPKRDLEVLRNRAGSVMTLDEARAAELRRIRPPFEESDVSTSSMRTSSMRAIVGTSCGAAPSRTPRTCRCSPDSWSRHRS